MERRTALMVLLIALAVALWCACCAYLISITY
jgi:hypothetical protein